MIRIVRRHTSAVRLDCRDDPASHFLDVKLPDDVALVKRSKVLLELA